MQALATVAMPSIQDLVEQELPALLPEPVTEDASLFEDGAVEDLFYQPADHLAHSEHLSTGFLDKLLADGNYEQAYQFLREMRDLGTDAPFSPKYGEVAWHIVRDSPHLSSQLAEQFLTWLTLIPPSDKLVHRPLRQITGRLLDVEIPNTLLLKRVALIYASKGFILQTGNMLNLIVRNTKSMPLKKFVDEFEAAYRGYLAQSTPHRLEDSIATVAYVRNNILRTLAASGRHREIKTFLPLSGEYQLWPSTYAFLLHYPKSAEVKERMRSMLEGLENHDEAAMLEVKERRLGRPIDFGDNLVAVWDALVATSASHDVEHLYARFLRLAHDRDYEQQRNDETADGKAPFKVPMAQASSFTPFLRPMMTANGPAAGVRIMRDILDLRLLPHTYIYTELAGFYARRGNVEKAFEIIDQLESRKKFNHRPPTGLPMRVRVPPPDLPFYVSVLRGLLISRNVEAAEEVVRRLFKTYTYVRRENYLLDAALADLKELKKVNNAWTRVDVARRSQPAHVGM
ncbi:hypothetical protein GALMADRAFT_1182417 [Galerina marginata CBS 339.88]|uniref:Pentacotripeptide-repeat region of PRORP domain-containing protein n=1 Tax=Galerina marginata (strain CBS 339.88) TaxID=685588 RepID=A0A067TAB6_GALM3|nr:hypothetical protein GALMADRAFT_1182417 [Galerina marginata CBS 339.88]